MAKRMKARRRGHLRQRGQRWVVTFRVNGKQVWRSFPTRTQAELYMANTQAQITKGQFKALDKVSFEEAARTWYRHGVHVGGDRGPWKPSTARDYRSALECWLLPAFGRRPLHEVTTRAIAQWRAFEMAEGRLPRRTAVKLTAILHGIFERARREYDFPGNPVDDLEPLRVNYDPDSYDLYEPEEVWALVREAANEQDGAVFLTAAFAGLRLGELVGLRVGDVDFQAQALRVLGSVDPLAGRGTTKGGRGRSVPMVPELASVLARLMQRDHHAGDEDPLFPGEKGYLDGSALRRRYKAAQKRAGLRPLRFHDLRHTFGSLAARMAASTRELQEWMGHADAKTTARYTHYRSRGDEAARLAAAFAVADPASGLQANGLHEPADGFHVDAAVEDALPAQAAFRWNEAERGNVL
jgi:integrase